MGYMDTYKAWCENEYFDEATRAELKSIAGDEKEIEDRFYKDLEFGTGGLRGVIGNGTNRMNVYIVRKATQGLANFIIKEGTQDKGVAISHDNRRMSREFAQEAKVNPNTMQRALAELEDIGLVHSMRTSGRFVTENTELITKEKNGIAADYVEQYYKQMQLLGYSVEDMVELLLQYKKERGEEDESGRM